MTESRENGCGRRSQEGAAPSRAVPSQTETSHDDVSFLVIGRIVAPHGVRGEVRVLIETDDPRRFLKLDRVYLGDGHAPVRVLGARLHKGQALMRLESVHDRDDAEALRGVLVCVSAHNALPLGENEYYRHQILDMTVLTEKGESLGQVKEILSTGANDVYVVQGHLGELLLPAIRDTILRVDLENSRMVVRVPEGLLP